MDQLRPGSGLLTRLKAVFRRLGNHQPQADVERGLLAQIAVPSPPGSVFEVTGTGRTATLPEGSGRYGQALSFDSGEEDCVTVEDAPDLQLTEEFTLQAWVRPADADDYEPIIYKETENSDHALTANVWAHVALTYDGAKLRLYLNGELQDTATAEFGALPSTGPLTIGCADFLEYEDFYDGLIDEVRIYNRALGEAEIGTDLTTPVDW